MELKDSVSSRSSEMILVSLGCLEQFLDFAPWVAFSTERQSHCRCELGFKKEPLRWIRCVENNAINVYKYRRLLEPEWLRHWSLPSHARKHHNLTTIKTHTPCCLFHVRIVVAIAKLNSIDSTKGYRASVWRGSVCSTCSNRRWSGSKKRWSVFEVVMTSRYSSTNLQITRA